MSAAIASPASPATENDEQAHLLQNFLKLSGFALFGLVALVGLILAFILFPFAALGYGGFCLARRMKNMLRN